MTLHSIIRIPSYNLYGEMGDLPDVVHCEAIATRSVLHDWHIKPHRHSRLHQFFLVESGGGQYHIDGQNGTLDPPQILNIPARSVHGFTFIAGTQGWVVTVPLEILDQNIQSSLRQQINTPHISRPDSTLIGLFDEIAREHAERRFARAHILQSLTALVAGRVIRMIAEQGEGEDSKSGSPLVRRFENLLEQHFCDHWTIGDYADALAVSTTHLTRVTKQDTGLPASKIIEGRLIQEARRDLAYTSLTISEIAYRIGYSDPAYFTRVFTRVTGVTPTAFRTGLEGPRSRA
ncbi:MAG: helix-turn-helix domain-containing protein [Rhizobiaceae bacterium]|nr:helix-turn-helix domain-containing protein [Rhizobiaceae bacterium]